MSSPEVRQTQLALYAAGTGMIAFAPFAALTSTEVEIWQLAWAALTIAGAWLLGRSTEKHAHRLMGVIGALLPALYAPVVLLTGGAEAQPQIPTFAWLVAMPLCLVVVFRAHRHAVISGALSALAVAVVVCAAASPPPAIFALRVLQVAVASAVAIAGAHAFAVSAARQRAAVEAQRVAAEQLAQSELRRERAERSIYLMRLASALAHEVNNPLAILMSNIQLLQADATEPDDMDALADALYGVERIRDVVDELRVIAGTRKVTQAEAEKAAHRRREQKRAAVELPKI